MQTMVRKMMLAGLMAATVMSGIAPAYAQDNPGRGGGRGERGGRMEGGRPDGGFRGGATAQPGGDMQQRWQQRAMERQQAQIAQPRPDRTGPDMQAQRWQQQPDRPDRGMGQPRPDGNWQRDARPVDARSLDDGARQRIEQQRQQQQNWRDGQRDARQDWRNDRRDDRQAGRLDWRNDRRDDRRADGRWSNGGWNGGAWGNGGRRYDDRTRWSDQRRWDSGWRQDRRYDWNSYRSRYGDRYRLGTYYAPRGWGYGYQRFSIGIFLNSLLYSNTYWLDDPYSYRLPPAYGTLRWVRYYDDALLVDIRDGYVVDVIHDFFW
jgi:hypothetical protein